MPQITADVVDCARCGNNHDKMEFAQLVKPIELSARGDGTFRLVITHWTRCPMTDEPVLMRFTGEENAG